MQRVKWSKQYVFIQQPTFSDSSLDASLPQVQFLYSLAILLSVPLQLFPAVRIMENGLFTRSGKSDTRIKWLKNIFRFCVVMTCTGISSAGAADLDKFVAFIGSSAWCGFPKSLELYFMLTILVRLQCSSVLRLPGYAALQSMRPHAQTEIG